MKNHFFAAQTVVILGLLLVLAADARAAERARVETPVRLAAAQGRASLGSHMSILEDRTGSMTIREASSPAMAARYLPEMSDSPSFGFNDAAYWVRVKLSNDFHRDEQWFIELDYPHMDIVEIYYRDKPGGFTMKKSGDLLPFTQREVRYRNFVFSIPVHAGAEQTIYLRFAGRCAKQFPLTLWSPAAFSEKIIIENFFLGIYYGIILVMMLYNLFLFFFIRDKSYLFYVIYIASYGLVQMAYNGLAYKFLWPAYPGWHNISIPFLIGLAIFLMAVFTRSFLHLKEQTRMMDRCVIGIMLIGAAVMAYSIFGDYLTAIESAMKLMVLASLIIIISAVVCMKRGFRPARFFLIAWIFFLCGLVLIALNKLHVLPVIFITEYANQIGSALEVTLLSLALADRINIINQEKNEAQLASIQAREKYRRLVEGTNDIIFSLDGKWNFLTINNAIRTQLKLDPDVLPPMNFLDLIYDETPDAEVSKKLILEKLETFMATREPLSFKAAFKSSIIAEPKQLHVKLECINVEGKSEILGKATSEEEDVLLHYFDSETQRLYIGNYLGAAEDVTQQLTRNMLKFMPAKSVNLARIALREMIINAIEHGNLDISYNEKTRAIMDDSYFELIARRREDPRFRDRRVRIDYSIDATRALFTITDEGKGFDHARVIRSNSRTANRRMHAHGRGISMARNIFDSVKYNKKGNRVTLIKNFNSNG